MRYAVDPYASEQGYASQHPFIKWFIPGPDTALGKQTPIGFALRDLGEYPTIRIRVHFKGKASETAYDGTAFLPLYRQSTKTRVEPTGEDQCRGWDFLVRRVGGWPASPRFEITGVDAQGNDVQITGGGPVPEEGGA